jgi:prevent-host-death family protein
MDKSGGHKRIAAGEFKQGCLAILDEVAERHTEYVITKRGKPVARVVPLESDEAREADVLTGLRSSVEVLVSEAELLAPTDVDAGWNLQD